MSVTSEVVVLGPVPVFRFTLILVGPPMVVSQVSFGPCDDFSGPFVLPLDTVSSKRSI